MTEQNNTENSKNSDYTFENDLNRPPKSVLPDLINLPLVRQTLSLALDELDERAREGRQIPSKIKQLHDSFPSVISPIELEHFINGAVVLTPIVLETVRGENFLNTLVVATAIKWRAMGGVPVEIPKEFEANRQSERKGEPCPNCGEVHESPEELIEKFERAFGLSRPNQQEGDEKLAEVLDTSLREIQDENDIINRVLDEIQRKTGKPVSFDPNQIKIVKVDGSDPRSLAEGLMRLKKELGLG